MGKKIMDIKTRRDASRGRKSKAGGGEKIKSDSRIYTPDFFFALAMTLVDNIQKVWSAARFFFSLSICLFACLIIWVWVLYCMFANLPFACYPFHKSFNDCTWSSVSFALLIDFVLCMPCLLRRLIWRSERADAGPDLWELRLIQVHNRVIWGPRKRIWDLSSKGTPNLNIINIMCLLIILHLSILIEMI